MSDHHAQLTRLTEDWDTPADSFQREAAALRYGLAEDLALNGLLVDVACGTGFGVDHVAAGGIIAVGGDLSLSNLQTARKRSSQRRWIQMDAAALPFRDGSADVVTCFEALYYLPSIADFLRDARRVLRPGGRLLVTLPNRDRPGFTPSPGSHRYPDPSELDAMFRSAGFGSRTVYGAFDWSDTTPLRRTLDVVRRLLGRYGLMPKSMAMRGVLKRLAYRNVAPLMPLRPITNARDRLVLLDSKGSEPATSHRFIVIYGVAIR